MKRFKKPAPTAWRCIVLVHDDFVIRRGPAGTLDDVVSGRYIVENVVSIEFGSVLRFHLRLSPGARMKPLPAGVSVTGWRVA